MTGFNDFIPLTSNTEPTISNGGFNAFVPKSDDTTEVGFNQYRDAHQTDFIPPKNPPQASSFADVVNISRQPDVSKEIPPPEDESLVAAIGRNEEQQWEGIKADLAQDRKPFKRDSSAGPDWLQQIGHAAAPYLAIPELAFSPFIATGSAIAQTAYKQSIEPEERATMSDEELNKGYKVTGSLGAGLAGVALAGFGGGEAPEVIKANRDIAPTTIDRSNPPTIDSSKQNEALANLSMSAKQPWKKSDNALDNIELPRGTKDINLEINQVAADTAAPGAKEKLAQLQQEKLEATNPQELVNRVARTPNGEITEDQYQANIAQPVQSALDAGVPVGRIKAELEASLPKTFDEPYRQFLLDRAIPPSAVNVADASPIVAKAVGTPSEVVEQLTQPTITDDVSPNVVKDAMQGLNAKQVTDELGTNTIWTKGISKFSPLEKLNRAWADLNGINLGRPDLLAEADTAYMRNIDERENGLGFSYLSGDKGVYEIVPGQTQLKINPDVMSQEALETASVNMGADKELLTKADSMFNAADNYANKDRVAQETIKEANDLRQKAAQLQAQLAESPEGLTADHLRAQLDAARSKITSSEKLVKILGEAKTYASREEVNTFMTQFKDNPAVQFYIQGRSKLNESALRNLVSGGKITQMDFDKMRAVNPHYTPAWREADDYTFDHGPTQSKNTDAFKRRDMSEKGAEQIDFKGNTTRYFLSTAKKAQDAQIRGRMLENFIKILNDNGWSAIFRESKADVLKAIDKLGQDHELSKLSSEQITPLDAKKFEYYDTVSFPVNGKQIELSVKDPNVYAAVSNAFANKDAAAGILKPLSWYSQVKVGLLTKWNPAFNVRNTQRALIDHNFNTLDGKVFRNYIPGGSQLKVLAQMFYKPELYNQFRREYGLTDPLVKRYKGMSVDQIVDQIKSGKQPNVVLSKIDSVLSGFADRGDALTRMLEYNLTYKASLQKGLSEAQAKDAALIAAKNIHLNFSQRGASGNYNAVVGVFPFGRAFLNAVDKTTKYGIYAPKQMALGATNIYILYKGIQTWNNQYKDTMGNPIDKQVDERIADQYWWIRTGPKVNDMVRIPNGWFGGHLGRPMNMTFGMLANKTGQFMDNMLEHQSDQLAKQARSMFPEVDPRLTGKELFEAWSNATTKLMTPDSLLPAGVGTVIGAKYNQDNMGHPIVPNADGSTPPSLNYFSGNTDYAVAGMTRDLSQKGYEVSPGMLQFYAREMAGAAGEGTLVAGAHMYGLMTGKDYPTPERGEIPGFNIISGNNSDVPHTGVEAQYYNMQQKISPIEKQAMAYEKAAKQFPEYAPIYQKFIQDNANELHWANQFRANNAELAKLKGITSKIAGLDKGDMPGYQDANPSITGDKTKRTSIDEIRVQMQSRMQSTLDSIREDMENGNSYAKDLWSNRHTNSPLTEILDHLMPSGSQDKPVDKAGKTSYNSPFSSINPISDANAEETNMHDMPPSIMQPASADVQEQYKPGFMEKYLPNLNKGLTGMYRDNIISNTIKQEGGVKFTQTPGDRGGATKFGITLSTLQKVKPGATVTDVANLSEAQARQIYQTKYWDAGQIDKMPIGVQDLVFDMSVEHGLGGSTIIVQRALKDLGSNVSIDGKLGNNTLNAMQDFKPNLLRLSILQERKKWVEDIVKNDPSQAKFLSGWKKRIADLDTIPEDIKQAEEV